MGFGWVIASCLAVVLAGCSKSTDGDGDGGDHDSGMELSCMERESIASSAVADALDVADQHCTTRDDCTEISIDTDCHAACGALVSLDGKAEVEQVIAAQNATICEGYEDDGCMRVIPPCEPPLDEFFCTNGRCSYEEVECIEHTLRWGGDGGLVASRQQFSLEPCATFKLVEIPLDGEPMQLCENEVPADGEITVAELNALIDSDDVQTAIADAPVVYGVDSRPVDGVLLRIEIDGAIIDVGSPCEMSDTCVAIPEGVSELAAALEDLFTQQHGVPPDCLGTD